MEDYFKKVIDELPYDIKGTASTPGTENLFKVQYDDKRKLLQVMKKIAFHH